MKHNRSKNSYKKYTCTKTNIHSTYIYKNSALQKINSKKKTTFNNDIKRYTKTHEKCI